MLIRILSKLINFLFSACLFSCSQIDTKAPEQTKSLPIIDTANFAIISFDQNYDWPFKHTYEPTELSINEIQLLELLMSSCLSKYNAKLVPDMKSSYGIDSVKYKYKKQYVAVVNDKGQKEVWVNGFCDAWRKEWKKEILMVHDGGNCYFNLKINLTTKECFEISVNGYA
jgi:hypothetical protein